MSKFAIRRALESALVTGMAAYSLPIAVGMEKLKPDPTPPRYLRSSISWGEDHATEIGLNPRIERSGRFLVGVFSDPKDLEDGNDVLVDLVRSCFPYGVDLVRDGIRVSIGTIDDSECIPFGSHFYAPVYVNFMVWSTTNA